MCTSIDMDIDIVTVVDIGPTYVCIYIYACTHFCAEPVMCVCVHTYIHTYGHMCKTYIYTQIVNIRTYTYIYIYIYIYIHIYIYRYIMHI